MELTTSLFDCSVIHGRVKPVKNTFTYKYFMFFIDLDDHSLMEQLTFTGIEKRTLYSFRKKDHYSVENKNTSDSIRTVFSSMGITGNYNIFLLTNLRTAGYQFNPVSFYFAVKENEFISCIAEVGNTFGEQKLFPLNRTNNKFTARTRKDFYVSPYSSLDAEFEFNIITGPEKFEIRINTLEKGAAVLYSRLEGKLVKLTDRKLLAYTLKFPLVTIKVISMIHWQAFKLWLKKAPFIRKKDREYLQKDKYKLQ